MQRDTRAPRDILPLLLDALVGVINLLERVAKLLDAKDIPAGQDPNVDELLAN
jgi:hypothetical protein